MLSRMLTAGKARRQLAFAETARRTGLPESEITRATIFRDNNDTCMKKILIVIMTHGNV